ncbi:M23 family metallopeptidase [Borrelia miyamotoi]|uniref:M23 family metallopeptidase n=1 Tax=Borrelia miyamotoi TaxID=47466 RepID=A0AAX3JMA3_9SPIR|nr:M23 family metallopeptidase [Borrelia miyamotoi]QFP42055.1 M23 family metallopeptidase [Borrelia miyamotoi]QFP48171.1 M23 family metallopeptidase [Borrelia miyamotoi]QGT55930.1 peptidoglycan DD-metalloendopeptidase family protein [Borrelia miyamotoi]QGT56710.1 peptidoglycan DD-metalloendopeptidase family protein [Borrelia miyamotoi]WAZ71971.1 M23 family metallopeptidase [Borrelia miyamotoi]
MIIPKKDQNVLKRNRNFLFDRAIKGDFALRDFRNINNFDRKKRSNFFYLIKHPKKLFNIIKLLFFNLVRLRLVSIDSYKYQYSCKNSGLKTINAYNVNLTYSFIFKFNVIIFALILVLYLDVFSYYGSYIFLSKLSFPKDYFIDTFLYYSDQDLAQLNNYLFGLDGNDYETTVKKPFVLKVVEHQIKPGETISHIAARYNITSETLISYNDIKDVRSIKPNLVINVPNMKGVLYVVGKNDSLSSIANKYKVSKVDILDANNLDNEVLHLGQRLFIPGGRMSQTLLRNALGETFLFPTQGVITSGYGYRPDPFTKIISFHNGIDIANAANTPILATKEGIVVKVGFSVGGYGRYIIISHNNGFQTLYAHLGSFAVKTGQKVSRGQIIGRMGSTGYSTGNHLHFTIFKDGKTGNPMKYLK